MGDVEAVKGMGGVVAPLLAGFCLATIAVLVTSSDPAKTPLAPWAVLCLTVAGVSFLYAVQYSFLAVQRGSPPSAYLDWDADARIHPERMHCLRIDQAVDRKLFDRLFVTAGWLYTVGMLAFLAGLALVLVPRQWQLINLFAVCGVGLAFLVELLWGLSERVPVVGRLARITRPILTPGREDVIAKVKPTVDEVPLDDLRRLGLFVDPKG